MLRLEIFPWSRAFVKTSHWFDPCCMFTSPAVEPLTFRVIVNVWLLVFGVGVGCWLWFVAALGLGLCELLCEDVCTDCDCLDVGEDEAVVFAVFCFRPSCLGDGEK